MEVMVDTRTDRARTLQEAGLTLRQIGKLLGVSRTTVCRILHPEYADRGRTAARSYKRKMMGVCAACGAPTRYNGHDGASVSEHCVSCASSAQRKHDYDLIVELRRRGLTQHEIAVHVGCSQPCVARVLGIRGMRVGRGHRQAPVESL